MTVRINPDVNAKFHASGGLAGATDYTLVGVSRDRCPLVRVWSTGKTEVFGRANQSEMAALIEGIIKHASDHARHKAAIDTYR